MRRRLPQKQMVEQGVLWMVRRLCNANHNSRVLLQLCLTMLHGPTDGAGDAGKHAGVVTASVEGMGGQVGAALCMELNSCGCVKALSQPDGCGCDQWHRIWGVTGNKALLPCSMRTMGISESTCHHKRTRVLEFQRWPIAAKVGAGCL